MKDEQVDALVKALSKDGRNVTLVVVPATNEHDVEKQRIQSVESILNGERGKSMKYDNIQRVIDHLAGSKP